MVDKPQFVYGSELQRAYVQKLLNGSTSFALAAENLNKAAAIAASLTPDIGINVLSNDEFALLKGEVEDYGRRYSTAAKVNDLRYVDLPQRLEARRKVYQPVASPFETVAVAAQVDGIGAGTPKLTIIQVMAKQLT